MISCLMTCFLYSSKLAFAAGSVSCVIVASITIDLILESVYPSAPINPGNSSSVPSLMRHSSPIMMTDFSSATLSPPHCNSGHYPCHPHYCERLHDDTKRYYPVEKPYRPAHFVTSHTFFVFAGIRSISDLMTAFHFRINFRRALSLYSTADPLVIRMHRFRLHTGQ